MQQGNIKQMSEIRIVLTSFDENTTSRSVQLHQNISGGTWVIFLGDMMNSKRCFNSNFFSLGQIQSMVKSESLKIKMFCILENLLCLIDFQSRQ